MTRVVLAARAAGPPASEDLCLAVVGRKLVVAAADGEVRFVQIKDLAGTEDLVPLGTLDASAVLPVALADRLGQLRAKGYGW